MELLCYIVLFVVSLVAATPYGYTTKGGAIAKAEASSASGALSGPAPLPFSIPTGSGYSGSFSKSSSSSFASSSASSSSSSSSFSFSGTAAGLNTFKTDNDGKTGGTGCRLGTCQLVGGQNIAATTGSSGHGSNIQGYSHQSTAGSTSTAGATSDSVLTSGTFVGENFGSQIPCSDKGCHSQVSGCEGTACNNGLVNSNSDLSGVPLVAYNSNTACGDGDCASKTSMDSIPATYNPNDIPVKIAAHSDVNSSDDAKQQSKNSEQGFISYNGNDCSHGNCKSPISSTILPTTELPLLDSYQNPSTQQSGFSSGCKSPDCNSGHTNLATDHNGVENGLHKPAIHLSPPNAGIGCTTGNCQTDYFLNGYRNPPTLNNLHDTSSIEIQRDTHCSEENCGNKNVPKSSGSLDCATGNCAKPLINQDFPGTTNPSNIAPLYIPNTICKSPDCNINIQQGLLTTESERTQSLNNLHTHQILPSGCNTPNCSPQIPSNPPGYINIHQSSPELGCNTPNCASGLHNFNVNNKNQEQTGILFTGNNLATNILNYTSTSQTPRPLGPTGCTTPNCKSVPYNKPHISNSQVSMQTLSSGYATTGSIPNLVSTNPISHNVPNTVSPTDSLKEMLPPYTGGFGAPLGILKPNELSPPSTIFPVTSAVVAHKDQNLPSYSGGFGAPTGLLQPTGPVFAPSVTHPSEADSFAGQNVVFKPNIHATGNPNSNNIILIPGSYGNTKPIHPSQPLNGILPSHIGSFGTPAGLVNPNQINVETSQKNTASSAAGFGSQTLLHLGTNTADSSKSAEDTTKHAFDHLNANKAVVQPISQMDKDDENLPPYTGGFEAPAGVLKPNDYTSSNSRNLNKLTITAANQPCSLGNCVTQTNPNVHTLKQTNSSKFVHVEASANSQADSVAYVGGFQGPPGFLKPYDDGKLKGSLLGGQLTVSSVSEGGTAHKNDNQDHSSASVIQLGSAKNTQAVAAAGAFSSGTSGVHSGQDSLQAGREKDTGIDAGCGGSCGSINSLGGSYSSVTGASQASSVAQTSASAGAFAGGYSTFNLQNTQAGSVAESKTSGDCAGCGGIQHIGGNGFGYSGAGHDSGLSSVNAKSVAGARAFGGFGSSFASSSAHASSGFPTKGGYGKR